MTKLLIVSAFFVSFSERSIRIFLTAILMHHFFASCDYCISVLFSLSFLSRSILTKSCFWCQRILFRSLILDRVKRRTFASICLLWFLIDRLAFTNFRRS